MKWRKISLSTTTDAVDLVGDMLAELGFEGIEIVDNVPITEAEKKAMFIDYLPDAKEDDGTAMIHFYMGMDESVEDMSQRVKEGLLELSSFVDVGSGEIEMSETADTEWINNWKAFFKPFRVDEDILIKPTWETIPEDSAQGIVIELDPGTAFGTGTHETTRLCIQGMKEYLTNDTNLLDVGCGSGILSIIGLKLGAASAVGTDIDVNAVTVSEENAGINGIKGPELTLYAGNIIDNEELQDKVGYGCYDLVTANILADVIIPLSAVIGKHIKPGGHIVTSGIIYMKKEEVRAAMEENGFEIVSVNEMGDWVSIIGRKPLND